MGADPAKPTQGVPTRLGPSTIVHVILNGVPTCLRHSTIVHFILLGLNGFPTSVRGTPIGMDLPLEIGRTED